jgi:alkaline phosphatase D
MQVECSTLESFKTIIRVASSEALPERDFTSKVLLEGLAAGKSPSSSHLTDWQS